ncbi:tyrosine-type recombinase/integrase [Gammaproteobacteria bacterium]|nr:tyrosine-type recombinase/integrase [Gammaproteobacteria bacterium]
MIQTEFISIFSARLSDYLAFRQLGGIEPKSQRQLLGYFDRFVHQQGFQKPWPSRELIEQYLVSSQHLQPGTRTNRLSVVRQFCRYLHQFEPQCYVPEPSMVRLTRPVRVAHIYTHTEIQAVVQAAWQLPPPGSLRPHTFATLFGLLYTTGLRCGEAFGLNLSDVDLEQNRLFITKGKFGKSRWVPISSSTADALRRYRHARLSISPSLLDSPFFVIPTGRRLYHTNVDHAFRRVLKHCGLRGGKGCPGPRLHHLRHTFACTRLLLWYREDKDINALLPALATYLGHININSTQVYLRATTALLDQANQRFAVHFHHNILPNGG